MKQRTVLALSLLFISTGLQAGGLPPEDNRMQAGYLPTPFSASELKAWCKPGYTTVYRIEAAGKDPFLRTSRFLESETGKARFDGREETPEGELIREMEAFETEWKALQGHASFEAARTTLTEEDLKVPAGEFACWKYVVDISKPGQSDSVEAAPRQRMTFWFAKQLPGPPVRMTQESGEQVVLVMELIEAKGR